MFNSYIREPRIDGLIKSQDEIEQARFDMFEFKQAFTDIVDLVQQQLVKLLSDEESSQIILQITDANLKLTKVDTHVESFAMTLSHMLLENTHEEDELEKSLKEIEVCYKKNKERLEKDLNKMEYKITQIRDTRERISLKHIKSLDIVEKFVHKVMPNSLTESQIQKKIINKGMLQIGSESERANAQLSSIEQIRNDLENDDIFILGYIGGGQVQHQYDSSLDDDNDNNISQNEEAKQDHNVVEVLNDSISSEVEKIQELKSEKKRILESLDQDQTADKILIDQLYDMEILKVKKSLRKERNSAAQSHRNELQELEMKNKLDLEDSNPYKCQSLKNSQKISKNLQDQMDDISRNSQAQISESLESSKRLRKISSTSYQEQLLNERQNPTVEDQSPLQVQNRYLKLTRSEQQPSKNLQIIKPLMINPQALIFHNSNEKQPPQQMSIIKQQKPFILNKKFVSLLKKNIQPKTGEGESQLIINNRQIQTQNMIVQKVSPFINQLSPKQ